MPAIPLTPTIQDEIFQTMRICFQDLPFYEKVIEPKIMKVIRDADRVEMDQKVHKRLTERYYDVAEFNKTEQGKLILTQIHIAVRACYVLILAHHWDKTHLQWSDISQLLVHYPEFLGQDETELRYLLQFRNMMRLALLVVPARLNKKLLINIAARLEGSGREYITGGGQKPCVTRRVFIYEREGNIQAEKRDERMRMSKSLSEESCRSNNTNYSNNNNNTDDNSSDSLSGKKRSQLNPSMKKLKMIRLASEDAKQYVRSTIVLPPSTALLALSRECSKHLLHDSADTAFTTTATTTHHNHTDSHANASSSLSSPPSSSAVLFSPGLMDDLLSFQPANTLTNTTSASTSATTTFHTDTSTTHHHNSIAHNNALMSYLVPAHQPCSGTLHIPVTVSTTTSSRSLSPHNTNTSTAANTTTNTNLNSLRRDISANVLFPPGFLSRQQTELLTSLWLQNNNNNGSCSSYSNYDWLAAWDLLEHSVTTTTTTTGGHDNMNSSVVNNVLNMMYDDHDTTTANREDHTFMMNYHDTADNESHKHMMMEYDQPRGDYYHQTHVHNNSNNNNMNMNIMNAASAMVHDNNNSVMLMSPHQSMSASVVLPMLRAISWDVVGDNGGFADDLARILASF